MKALAWLAVMALVGQGGKMVYEDKASALKVSNYTVAEGGSLENGDFEFDAKGNPLELESNLQGIAMKAASITGVVGRAVDKENPKVTRSFFRTLDAKGNPVVLFDNESQYKALVAHANAFKLTLPAPLKSVNKGKLVTSLLTYSGDALQGTFTLPAAFTLDMTSNGKRFVESKVGEKVTKVEKTFSFVGNTKGSSGTILLNPAATELNQLETGKFEGPVTFHAEQTESSALAPEPEVTVLDAKADRIEFDLKTANTVTLIGNVKFTGEGTTYTGSSEADKAVITLDPITRKPIKVIFTGGPTHSVVKEKKTGGNR